MITAGLDMGTRFAKICVVDKGRVIGSAVSGVDRRISLVIRDIYKQALLEAGISRWRVRRTALTGYGAGLAGLGGRVVSEERCAAAGVLAMVPQARAVVDAGGIFIHAVALGVGGQVLDCATNEKCAAGGGKFLEMVCQALQTDFEDLSRRAEESRSPYFLSSNCAVFAESEVISQVNAGTHPSDILAGVVDLVAARAATLLGRVAADGPVALAGGVSRIPAFRAALEKHIGRRAALPDFNPQLAAAYGAALLAAD